MPRLDPGQAYSVRFSLEAATSGRRVVTATATDARKTTARDEKATVFQAGQQAHGRSVPWRMNRSDLDVHQASDDLACGMPAIGGGGDRFAGECGDDQINGWNESEPRGFPQQVRQLFRCVARNALRSRDEILERHRQRHGTGEFHPLPQQFGNPKKDYLPGTRNTEILCERLFERVNSDIAGHIAAESKHFRDPLKR